MTGGTKFRLPARDHGCTIMADLLTPLVFSGVRLRNRIVMPPMWSGQATPQGDFVPYAAAIKARVAVPVMVTGGIREPALADRIVREGSADLVGIGRAMLEDPDWARKAIEALAQR